LKVDPPLRKASIFAKATTGQAGGTDRWYSLGLTGFREHSLLVSSVVSQDPQILGGEPVFAGTRVPVKSLFDHLEAGDSIEEFLEGFPSVKRQQVIALLEEAREHAVSAR
jgi:uncharacterized protein (DUF433 family)